jgi:hypothetical protein
MFRRTKNMLVQGGSMNILSTVLVYGLFESLSICGLLLAIGWFNPRIMLHDYPKDIRQQVPPKTPAEKRQTWYWGTALLLVALAFPVAAALSVDALTHRFLDVFLSAFGVLFLFNVVDWLLIDWLIFCTITPAFIVLAGTEGMAGYKNYAMHFRGFLIGTVLSVVVGLVIAVIMIVV